MWGIQRRAGAVRHRNPEGTRTGKGSCSGSRQRATKHLPQPRVRGCHACLRNAGPRVPTGIFQRHQGSGDYTIKRFPVLQIAQRQFFDLNNSMNQEASTDCRKAENCFTDIGFFDHSIPLAKPLPTDRPGSRQIVNAKVSPLGQPGRDARLFHPPPA